MPRLMRRMLERCFLGLAGAVPAHWMKHGLFLLRSNPHLTDKWEHHIRPIHFYEPLPDFSAVRARVANRRLEFPGIDFDLKDQLARVRHLAAGYGGELAEIQSSSAFPFRNDWFGGLDAALYYALVRDRKPDRIVEIGAGYSTRIAARALERNRQDGHPGHIICIEPHPTERLTDAGLDIELVESGAEAVSAEYFSDLGANDILFIDSSHVARFGSDVCRLFRDVVPRLPEGVWVHVHDIFFPTDYPADWVMKQRIAFNEQYLLAAYLCENPSAAPRLAARWLLLDHGEDVRSLWPVGLSFHEDCSSSFWFERVHG